MLLLAKMHEMISPIEQVFCHSEHSKKPDACPAWAYLRNQVHQADPTVSIEPALVVLINA